MKPPAGELTAADLQQVYDTNVSGRRARVRATSIALLDDPGGAIAGRRPL
ncbi:hypothetical protein [Streptomyces agglomeratus]|nr:hypothetical protein [Streptomyces agglomeratus]